MSTILDIEPPPGCIVRFISDLHLAHKRSQTPAPAKLLEMMQGIGMLVLCGDTAETRLTCAERERSIALRAELRRLCREQELPLVELAGNHDPDIEPQLARFWGGKVIAMHGHSIMKEVSPWSREYMNSKQTVRSLIAEHPEADHDLAARLELTQLIAAELSLRVPPKKKKTPKLRLLSELYHCFWPPQRPLSIVLSWLTCGARAEKWAARFVPQAEIFILGHFHRSGHWHYGSRTILNTGAWFEHAQPYAVDVQDARLLRYFPLNSN